MELGPYVENDTRIFALVTSEKVSFNGMLVITPREGRVIQSHVLPVE